MQVFEQVYSKQRVVEITKTSILLEDLDVKRSRRYAIDYFNEHYVAVEFITDVPRDKHLLDYIKGVRL